MQQMSQPKEPEIGLVLQLRQFPLNWSNKSISDQTYTVLGHYDGLEIRRISRWMQFLPGNDVLTRLDERGNERLVSDTAQYSIRLLFPEGKISSLFDYNAWRNPQALLSKYPCFSVVLINLTNNYKEKQGVHAKNEKLLEDFAARLGSVYKKGGEYPHSMQCAIFLSIGYSDFCILTADQNWKNTMSLIHALHNLCDENLKSILSTDYLIPVYNGKASENIENSLEGLKLSARVNLAPNHIVNIQGIKIFRISSGSDYLFYASTGPEIVALLKFLTDNSAYITAVEPILHLDISQTSTLRIKKSPDISDLKHILNEFERIVKQYREYLVKHRRHMRQTANLYELAANIWNICSQAHTGLLRKIMIRLIECFADCLDRCNKRMGKLSAENYDEIQQMQQSVDELQRRIISFITDFSHSDSFFMDRGRYNHPSVSSAASLLLGYNLWLNDFADAVGKTTQDTNNMYAYLITSGGCDETLIFNAFYFLHPWNAENGRLSEYLPLVVQMSEMSLFDFSGTILRAVHECMHHCGERNRENRYKHYIGFISQFYAEKLSNAIFDKGELDHAYGYIDKLVSKKERTDGEIEKIKHDISNAYKEIKEEYVIKIKEVLQILLQRGEESEAAKQLKERDYLFQYVMEDINGLIFSIFSVYEWYEVDGSNKKMQQNAFSRFLYDKGQEAEDCFSKRCADILEKCNIDTMCFSFENEKLQVFKKMDKNKDWQPHNQLLWIKVEIILTQMLKRDPFLKSRRNVSQKMFEKIIPYTEYISSGTFLASVVDIFSESFADVAACTILGAEIEDYILMHVFETWSIPEALDSESFSYKFRIPAVLYVCFPNCIENGDLTAPAQDRIRTAIQKLVLHGLKEERIKADEVCDAISKLLGKWTSPDQRNWSLGNDLLIYLQECKQIYERQEVQKALACYAKSFKNLRLWGNDNPAKVLSLFYELVNWNGGLGHG